MIDETNELPFSAAFSARVLQQVDDIRRRRRARRSGIAVAATTMVVAVAVVVGLRSAPPAQQISVTATPAMSDDLSAAAAPPSDPLALMFPDAEPLARFSDQYAAANVTPAEERNAFAFAADTDEGESQDL